MTSAREVARYLADLSVQGPDPEPLSAGRLHRLLYLAQGWHLGSFGRPLFADPIAAGPVVPGVDPADVGADLPPFRDRRFVDAVWERYRRYSATGLREVVGEVTAEQAGVDALRAEFARAPELRGFDPEEWEIVTERGEDLDAGHGVTLAEFMRRVRSRRVTT